MELAVRIQKRREALKRIQLAVQHRTAQHRHQERMSRLRRQRERMSQLIIL